MYELPDICWIVNRAAVIDAIVAFANAIDAKDWDKLRSHSKLQTYNIRYIRYIRYTHPLPNLLLFLYL
jgi:hypothetical protein